MQDDNEIDFFWRKPRIDSRGRFNLLLLEYGETFHENLSCNQYPFPNQNLTFVQCDALKCKGRLHICSRSMIFEPNDIKCPLLKFPYKLITSNVEQYYLKAEEVLQCTSATSGFVTFSCSSHFEMKNNDKVGPYKLMSTKSQFVFALIHTDIIAFFHKMKQLRGELTANMKGGGRGQNLFAQSFKSQTFDSSQLIDFNERLLFLDPVVVFRVGPLVLHPGELMVTDTRIYFQPSNLNNIEDLVQHLDVKKIKRIFSRRYLLRQTGMEISFDKSCTGDNDREMRNVYFVFETTSIRDHIIASIKELPLYPNIVNDEQSIESMTWKWQKKKVSNFKYLLFLNSEADRSFSDLTQYPVMPHIIKDYGSNKLDFTKEETFRDLSKPIGALNPQRLAFFKERYEAMLDIASDPSQPGDNHIPVAPPFLYGTHYSTPGYVLFFLVRQAPEYMLCLQSGKFDAPDRMFYSISSMFSSCLSNPADLKELIPEFFYGEGEFLYNTENLDLGCRHNGERVHDVELPPWAKNPKDFVRKSREALESDYVSAHLHEWIDLIFGYKQRGDAAIAADNLFYHLTYEGSLGIEYDLSASQAESFSNFNPASRKEKNSQTNLEREANDIQVQEFGQTPKQLFSDPHPRKGSEMADIDITKSKGRRSSLGLTGNETAMTSLKANSIEQPSLERKSLTTTGLDTSMSKSWSKGMDIYKKAKDRVMNARIIDRKDNAMTVDSKSHSTISNNNNLNDTEELRKDTTKTMQHSDFLARGGPSPTLLDLLPESLVVSVKKEVDKNDDDKNWRKNKNDNGVNFEVHDDKQFPSVNHSLDPSSIFNQEVVVMEESALVTPTSPITVRMRSLCDSLPEKTGNLLTLT
jgi:factor associated with neutral sphingomyelinase activation